MDDDESIAGDHSGPRDLEWWGGIGWEDILCMDVSTTSFLSKNLFHAIATCKIDLRRYIQQAKGRHNETEEIRGWKASLSADALLFSDVQGSDTVSR